MLTISKASDSDKGAIAILVGLELGLDALANGEDVGLGRAVSIGFEEIATGVEFWSSVTEGLLVALLATGLKLLEPPIQG